LCFLIAQLFKIVMLFLLVLLGNLVVLNYDVSGDRQKLQEVYKGLWLFFRVTENDSCCKTTIAT
jgi:hypothetical protein